MGETLRIDFSDPAHQALWNEYVAAHPDTRYSDLAGWRPLFQELYGFENFSYAYLKDGRVRGIGSLYDIRSRFFGHLLVSSPFFGYGGLYGDDAEAEAALLDAIDEAAGETGADFVEIRLGRSLPDPYVVANDFLEFSLDLDANPEEVWENQLSSNVRQNVRKSQKAGLAFQVDRETKPIYSLLSRTLRELGTPFHNQRFFDLLRKHLPEETSFATVRLEDEVVAGAVLVQFRDQLSTPYVGSLKSSRAGRANYHLYWEIIRHCFTVGIRTLDFGRSPVGTTHAQFKEKWGASGIPAHYNCRSLNPSRPYRSVADPPLAFRLASSVWKKTPLAVTRSLGHRFFRSIP